MAGPCPFCGGRDRAHVRPGSSANFIGSCRRCGADGIALARALVGDVGEAWPASNGPGRPALLRHSGRGGPAAFVEAAAGAEGQDALARSVDAFDLARKHDKAEALRVLSVEAWLWAGYLGLSRVDPDLGLAADTARSVAHSGLTAPRDRFARTPAGGRLSALTVVWRARTRPAITARRDPILPRITLEPVNAPRARGGLIVAPVSGRAGLGDTSLPLFPDAPQHDIAEPYRVCRRGFFLERMEPCHD